MSRPRSRPWTSAGIRPGRRLQPLDQGFRDLVHAPVHAPVPRPHLCRVHTRLCHLQRRRQCLRHLHTRCCRQQRRRRRRHRPRRLSRRSLRGWPTRWQATSHASAPSPNSEVHSTLEGCCLEALVPRALGTLSRALHRRPPPPTDGLRPQSRVHLANCRGPVRQSTRGGASWLLLAQISLLRTRQEQLHVRLGSARQSRRLRGSRRASQTRERRELSPCSTRHGKLCRTAQWNLATRRTTPE